MAMSSEEMIEQCLAHNLFSWSATDTVSPLPIARAEGVWLYAPDGRRWLDFNSLLMSVNIGHGHPHVIRAIQRQAETLCFAHPSFATEIRARVSSRLAKLVRGDLNTFFFTLGGAEANENAIRAARQFTGRQKILARYRSYHGATHGALSLTGEPRGWHAGARMPGVVHVLDPEPYDYAFGADEESRTRNNLRYLEEVIRAEGPHTIAAMFIETVTGTNGILPPPKGYLRGLKSLLERYDILLVCDEVMAGWGRTGRRFAFEHGDIVPDIVTMAKGLTSSYMPLGVMGVSDRIADHFREHTFFGGLTYNAHPMCLAAADAVMDVFEEEQLIEKSARMGEIMRGHMARLAETHPSVLEYRSLGLFGAIELRRNAEGERLVPFGGSHPAMGKLLSFLREEGLFTVTQWSTLMCNPPLCISEEELRLAFDIIDRGLAITDEVFRS